MFALKQGNLRNMQGNACFETKSAKYVCNEDASDDDKYTIVIINQFNNLPFLM